MELLAAAEGTESLASPHVLILIGAGAFLLPLVAGRFRLPAIVLEIAFGVIIGPDVLHLIEEVDQESIALLAELGLLMLMFLAGFEVDFERIERQGLGQLLTGLGLFGLVLGAGWLGTGLLDLGGQDRWFTTLLISAASVGIVIPALRATRRATTRLGQTALLSALVAEFLSLIGIVVLGVWVTEGFSWGLLKVPALFLIMVLGLVVVRRAAFWYPERFERLFSSDDPDELGIRASLALLFVFVGVSVTLGVEGILGAFLAGALFAYIFRNTGTLEERLGGFAYGFFIPIFFINVGIRFPARQLAEPEVLGTAFGLIAVAIVIKLVPSLVLMARSFSFRESIAIGVLLAGQLSVIIALAELGEQLDLLSSDLAAGAVLLVAITAVFSPVVFRILAPPLAASRDAEAAAATERPR